jgi:hypothetical protein
MSKTDFGITNSVSKCIDEVIEKFANSKEDNMAMPGLEGFFITRDGDKGDEVIYIAEREYNNEVFLVYHMNPVYKKHPKTDSPK